MHCKLCQREGESCKAHILPEAFYRNVRDDDGRLIMMSADPVERTKRAPIGVYDRDLLCRTCEPLFGDWDSYGSEFFLQRLGSDAVPVGFFRDGRPMAYRYEKFDYSLLKLLIISVLWRAAASGLDFYRRVTLGPYEEAARQLVLRQHPGGADDFPCVMTRWYTELPEQKLAHSPMNPFCERIDGVNFVRLYLGPVVAYVKTDRRPVPKDLRPAVMAEGMPLLMVSRRFETSNEFLVFMDAIFHQAR